MKDLSRLVFLSLSLRDRTPNIPRALHRFIPQIEIVLAAKAGLEAAAQDLGVPVNQLKEIYQIGEAQDEWEQPNPQAFRLAVANAVLNNIDDQKLTLEKRLEVMGTASRFVKEDGLAMVAGEEVDLWNIKEFPEIEKWECGFTPVDMVSQGMYQALVMLIAFPGAGKTSHMLSLAESMKRLYPESPLKFFQQEIPAGLFQGRMKPIAERGNPFTPGDKLYTSKSLEEILEIVMEDPSNDQLLFIDSPDAMSGPNASAVDGGRRFDLENIYRSLVGIKPKCKVIFVPSQPKAKDRVLYLTSAAESFAKTWYVDMMIGFWPVGVNRIHMKILKNRFGPLGMEVRYNYNYATLEAHHTFEFNEWDSPNLSDGMPTVEEDDF